MEHTIRIHSSPDGHGIAAKLWSRSPTPENKIVK